MDQKNIDKINKFFNDKIFYYEGPTFYGLEENFFPFEYKIKILEEKPMISVGDWKDYLILDINITKIEPKFSGISEYYDIIFSSKNSVIVYNLTKNLEKILKHLGFKNILINNINFNNKEFVNESKMYRSVIRNVVRDVINVIKNDLHAIKVTKLGYYGEGDNKFKVIVKQNLSDEEKLLKPVDVTGYWDEVDKIIELEIDVDKNSSNEVLFEIIGELNDIVRHELEHQRQYLDDYDFPSKEYKQPLRYYTQPHEIEAQIAGFKRLAKLQKKPLDDVMMDFFQKRKGKYNLSNTTIKKIIDRIKEYGQV